MGSRDSLPAPAGAQTPFIPHPVSAHPGLHLDIRKPTAGIPAHLQLWGYTRKQFPTNVKKNIVYYVCLNTILIEGLPAKDNCSVRTIFPLLEVLVCQEIPEIETINSLYRCNAQT